MKYIEINIDNIIKNILYLKSKLKKGVLFCAVVKANAYGHGFEICKYIESYVDYFAVATSDEAIKLRKLGVKKRLLVLGKTSLEEKKQLVKNNIEITISSLSEFYEVFKMPAKIHLKLNTGMNRLGLKNESVINKIMLMKNKSACRLVGVFSHFYNSQNIVECERQNEVFRNLTKKIKNKLLHISSSESVLLTDKYNYSMVRCGIAMYGYTSNYKEKKYLLPALKVFATVIQKNIIIKGECVGYSSNYQAKHREEIYVLNCGYYDGFSRLLACNGYSCNNKKIYYCGNICMDMLAIKCQKKLSINESVCLLDNADKLAKICKTIPYEILTNIKPERFIYIIKKPFHI